MKSLALLKQVGVAVGIATYVAAGSATSHAAVKVWDAGGSAGSTAWYTAANWSPDTASGAWATGDVAQFDNAGTATTAGINMTTASLSIGAIDVTSLRTRTLTIGSSATTGTLTLNGAMVNGVANTILRNANTGSNAANTLFTLQNNETGTGKTMNIALGNVTDNVVQIDGIGNIAISSIISGAGKHITVQGTGSGRLLLTGANTFSGGVTVKTGATLSTSGASNSNLPTNGPLGTGQLTIDGGTFIPTSSAAITIGNNITLTTATGNTINVGGGPATLTGNIASVGVGGFRKGSSGILILTGANNYTGRTVVDDGTLAFAKTQSFYSGIPGSWTDANFTVNATFDMFGKPVDTGTLVLAVGGSGEFTLAQFLNLATVGSGIGGFQNGSNIGIDTTNGGDQTISTVFTDVNAGANKLGLVKSGTNTLFLTNANTHHGPTISVGGTLNLSNQLAVQNSTLTTSTTGIVVFDQSVGTAFTAGGLAGAGALALQNNAGTPAPIQLTVGGNNVNANFTGNLSGAASSSLTKVGTGTQTLGGTNTGFAGTVFLNEGTLAINSNTAFGNGASLVIGAGTTINNTSGGNRALSTSYTQTWNGNLTYLGANPDVLPLVPVALNLGNAPVTLGANVQITTSSTVDSGASLLTIDSVISDGGNGYTLTKAGPARLNLNKQNTFTGGVTVLAGTVHANEQSSDFANNKGPLGTGTLTLNGGRLISSSVNATVNTIENNITLIGLASGSANSITSNGTLTLPGVISGSGGWTKSGNGAIILTNANTFSGSTAVVSGASSKLILKNELALQNSTLIASSTGGFIDFDASVVSNAFTLGGLSDDRNIALQNNAGSPAAIALSVGKNSTTYSGALSGPGSLIKIGSGTTTLSGNSSYAGTTTVNNGVLLINGSQTGGAAYMVNGGTLGGTGTISANVNLVGGTLAPGASIESLDIVGNLSLSSGTFEWEFNNTTADRMNISGALSIASAMSLQGFNLGGSLIPYGTKYTVLAYGSGTPGTFAGFADDTDVWAGWNWRINYNDDTPGLNVGTGNFYVTLTAVPEASSILVMGLGGVFAIGAIRFGKRYGLSLS